VPLDFQAYSLIDPSLIIDRCHTLAGRRALAVRLILDERHNHAVEVEKEHDEMETKLGERFLWQMLAGCCQVLSRPRQDLAPTFLWTLSFLKISVASSKWVLSTILHAKTTSAGHPSHTPRNDVPQIDSIGRKGARTSSHSMPTTVR
jgi:hypothetical protein